MQARRRELRFSAISRWTRGRREEYFRGKSCRKLHFSGSASFSRHLTQFPVRDTPRQTTLSPIAATASEPKQRVTGSTEATDNNLPPRACAFQIIGNRKFSFPTAYGQGTGRTFSFRRTSSSWAPRNALGLSIISRGRRTRGRKLGKFSSDAVMGQAFREYLFGTLKFASGS